MRHLQNLRWYAVVFLIPLMWTYAHGDTPVQPQPLELVRSSKYYGKMTKTQASEIIEKSAKEIYKADALVDEKKFFMGVPDHSYPQTSGVRTTTKFKWSSVEQIQVQKSSIHIFYKSSFFSSKLNKTFKLAGETYDLADIALAAMTLTGLPLTQAQPIEDKSGGTLLEKLTGTKNQKKTSAPIPASSPGMQKPDATLTLEERLKRLKDLYDKGLLSNEVYESKQKELLDRMFD